MLEYRIYRLDQNGSITTAGEDFECPNDKAAIALAFGLIKDSAGAEIWIGSRLVAQVRADGTRILSGEGSAGDQSPV